MPQVIPVILSGGSGTRLWPKSRKAYPKQLHNLYGDYTMLQHTVRRVNHLSSPIVVCNEAQRFMVAEQLSEVCVDKPTIILEPVGRNTAPAIAVAAYHALTIDPEAIIAVFAADHLIEDQKSFCSALNYAYSLAESKKLVAFGVVPTKPETGYGYIKTDSMAAKAGAKIDCFVEKPDLDTAKSYIESGEYLWNSGMFVFSAKRYLSELEKFQKGMAELCRLSYDKSQVDLDFIRIETGTFSQCADISVDYAVMEKTEESYCVSLDCGWSDLGDWNALWEVSEKDSAGNVQRGDVIARNCSKSMLIASNRLVVGVGLEDIVVVDTDDSLLVINKSFAQETKNIVTELKNQNREELNSHRKVYRPWGSYDSIDSGDRYQVKCIEVKPGASLSLQMHHHRAEHWVVVTGTALVQRGSEEILLSENESIYIPLGEQHRLSNPGKVSLQLIEVQSGAYLGEDDIVRYEDGYGRTS